MGRRDKFDETFDALLAGALDGVSGGRLTKIREHMRDVVAPALAVRPFAALFLRQAADVLDPPKKRTKVKHGRRQTTRERE